jgi:hypothetical protein
MTVQPPTPAELAGRIAVARAASAEYGRQLHTAPRAPIDYREQANTLNAALAGVLLALDGLASHSTESGMAYVAPDDVGLVVGALDDGRAWRELHSDPGTAARYLGLARALGADL